MCAIFKYCKSYGMIETANMCKHFCNKCVVKKKGVQSSRPVPIVCRYRPDTLETAPIGSTDSCRLGSA